MKNKKKYFSFLISHFSFTQRGFTLIELMVVLSIAAILGTLGIAGFVTYNQIQVLQSSANDLVATLNLARSRAQSQVKPSLCEPTLQGYKVDISISDKNYTLSTICPDQTVRQNTVYTKSLPTGVSFEDDPAIATQSTTFTFPVLVGGVKEAGKITLSAYQRSKVITINALGGVSVQ